MYLLPLLALLSLSCRNKDGEPIDTGTISEESDSDGDGVLDDEDCAPDDASIFPGNTETPYNGADDDCDELTLDDDLDQDGFTLDQDCDDEDAAVHPDAVEACDSVDNDCNGEVDDAVGDTWYRDEDGDGHGDADNSTLSCTGEGGWVADDTDCDDKNAGVSPVATERCNSVDDDCDGSIDEDDALDATTWYADSDGDTYGDPAVSTPSCVAPAGYVADDGDCDDSKAVINPAAAEICDEIDNNCDGWVDEDDPALSDASTWYQDADGDSYGSADYSVQACEQPTGYVDNTGDCDDGEASAWTGNSESCDGVDNDCDGSVDEDVLTSWTLDQDGDGYGLDATAVSACTAPGSDWVSTGGDCDDSDSAYSPGATAGCDGNDYDCDGSVDNDADGDGYADDSCGGDDCDDSDATVYPDGGGCALGTDCNDILTSGKGSSDGSYTIDPDGYGTGADPFDVYCDMSHYSGGWTLLATNDWSGGYWSTTTIVDGSTTGSISLSADFKSDAWNELPFTDLMFEDGSSYGVYEGVGDGSTSWYDFQAAIPVHNCGLSSGYEWSMTDGSMLGSTLCNTNLYVHSYDYDGTYGCRSDNNGFGPHWSSYNDNSCILDDPYGSSFLSQSWSHDVWDTSGALRMWAR